MSSEPKAACPAECSELADTEHGIIRGLTELCGLGKGKRWRNSFSEKQAWAGEMSQWVRHLQHKNEDLRSNPQNPHEVK